MLPKIESGSNLKMNFRIKFLPSNKIPEIKKTSEKKIPI